MNKKENQFDKAAASWDDNPIRTELARSVSEKIIEAIPLSKTMCALEFGCGTGLVTLQLAPRLKEIVAIDSSAQMLEVLNQKTEAMGYDNVSTYKADAEAGVPPDRKADLVFSSMTSHHIEDIDALLRLFSRSLNPGGYVAIADLDKEDGSFHGDAPGVFHYGFDRGEFAKRLESAGFTDVKGSTAYVIRKKNKDGDEAEFPVFLMTGRKPF